MWLSAVAAAAAGVRAVMALPAVSPRSAPSATLEHCTCSCELQSGPGAVFRARGARGAGGSRRVRYPLARREGRARRRGTCGRYRGHREGVLVARTRRW